LLGPMSGRYLRLLAIGLSVDQARLARSVKRRDYALGPICRVSQGELLCDLVAEEAASDLNNAR
jgi:hypothetical protein